MTKPSSFDHGAEDWDEFQKWLVHQHREGNNLLGLGTEDTGFVAYNQTHLVDRNRESIKKLQEHKAIEILHHNHECYIYLEERCIHTDIYEQLRWTRQFFLPITL